MIRCLVLIGTLLLVSCGEDSPVGTTREESRIQQEVAKRVDAMRAEMKTAETRWRTIRIATLSLLAGGSLILLLGGYADKTASASPNRLPGGDYQPRRRVIDRPYDDPDDDYPDPPYRR